MTRLPVWRIALLRVGYLLIAGGLGMFIVPRLISPPAWSSSSAAVVTCFLTAMMTLCALGVWRPLAMLPVLLFELVWKIVYMTRVALPAWLDGTLTGDFEAVFWECVPILLYIPIVPWRHVWRKLGPRGKDGGPPTA